MVRNAQKISPDFFPDHSDNRDNYENYDYYDEETEGVGGSQQIAPPSLDESDKSGVTSAVTTSSKQAATEPSPSSRESGEIAPSVADAAHQASETIIYLSYNATRCGKGYRPLILEYCRCLIH